MTSIAYSAPNPFRRNEHSKSDIPVTSVTLFVTDACNLACDYCFVHDKFGSHMSWDTAIKTLNWLISASKNEKNLNIIFFGGEPFIRFEQLLKPFVPEARRIAAAKGKNIRFSATTNAVLLKDFVIDWCKENDIHLNLSLDGIEEAQNAFRVDKAGRGSFERVMSKLPKISAAMPSSAVRMTISPETVDHFRDGVEFLLDSGFQNIGASPVMEADWSDEKLEVYRNQAHKIGEIYITRFGQAAPFSFPAIDKALGKLLTARLNPSENDHPCGAGKNFLAVNVDGGLFPCHRFLGYSRACPSVSMGSIEQGLDTRVQSYFQDTTAKRMTTPQPDGGRVNSCECSAGAGACMAVNFDLNRDVTAGNDNDWFFSAVWIEVSEAVISTAAALNIPAADLLNKRTENYIMEVENVR